MAQDIRHQVDIAGFPVQGRAVGAPELVGVIFLFGVTSRAYF